MCEGMQFFSTSFLLALERRKWIYVYVLCIWLSRARAALHNEFHFRAAKETPTEHEQNKSKQ